MGVIVGVAVIVTMVSFGLGLQSNMLERFKRSISSTRFRCMAAGSAISPDSTDPRGVTMAARSSSRANRTPTRILDDAGIKEIAAIGGVAYVEPSVSFTVYVRSMESCSVSL